MKIRGPGALGVLRVNGDPKVKEDEKLKNTEHRKL